MVGDEILLYCPKCDDYYSEDNFHRNKTARGRASYCKACTSEVSKWYWKKYKAEETARLQEAVRIIYE